MPDPTLSAAIAEAYASAPVGLVIHHTLEIDHPALSVPIRVVRDRAPLDARLEASAPRNPGEVVTFAAYAFDIQPPEQTPSGAPQCLIEIDNVSREIAAQIDAVVHAGDEITVRYRAFLSSDPLAGPENDPPLSLSVTSITVTPFRISAVCGFRNLLNRRFPGRDYDAETFPGLVA